MRVTRSITRAPQLHVLGACSGGITSAALLAYLGSAKGGSDWARSLTLLVSILDIDGIADSSMGLFAHLETLDLARTLSGARGVLEGQDLAKVFAWLRPNELIFNYWVNNYLLGQKPPAFDVLYWNADTTRLPARLHADFIALLEIERLHAARRRDHRRPRAEPAATSPATATSSPAAPTTSRPGRAAIARAPARRPQRVRAQLERPCAVDRQPAGQQEGSVRHPGRRARHARGLRAGRDARTRAAGGRTWRSGWPRAATPTSARRARTGSRGLPGAATRRRARYVTRADELPAHAETPPRRTPTATCRSTGQRLRYVDRRPRRRARARC